MAKRFTDFISSHKLSRVKVPLTQQRAIAFLGLKGKLLRQLRHNEKYEDIAILLNEAVASQTKIYIENGGKMSKKHSELYYEINGLHVFHEAYQYLCHHYMTPPKMPDSRQNSIEEGGSRLVSVYAIVRI